MNKIKWFLFIPASVIVKYLFMVIFFLFWTMPEGRWGTKGLLQIDNIAIIITKVLSVIAYYSIGILIIGDDIKHRKIANWLLFVSLCVLNIFLIYFCFIEDEILQGISTSLEIVVCALVFIINKKEYQQV